MPSLGRMCYLTTVVGAFQSRVVAGRLGAEGVVVVLRSGNDDLRQGGRTVDVLVPVDQLPRAREILVGDAVEEAFGTMDLGDLDLTAEIASGAERPPDSGIGNRSLRGGAASTPGDVDLKPTAEDRAEMWAERQAWRRRNTLTILAVVMVGLLMMAALASLAVLVASVL
ncbi:MAG: hypothetical protein ACRD0Z_17635 [Acidimicrobiales bacterium]